MNLLHVTLFLVSGLLCGAITVPTAQDSPAQDQFPGLPVPVPKVAELPAPAGPFGVGRIRYEWIDSLRPDMHSANPLKHRDLMVYLWYPSQKATSGKTGMYLPGAVQMNADPSVQAAMKAEFEDNWPSIVSGAIDSHAVDNAPVAKAPKEFPVVIFSHGNGGMSFEYTSLIEDMVSRDMWLQQLKTHTSPRQLSFQTVGSFRRITSRSRLASPLRSGSSEW